VAKPLNLLLVEQRHDLEGVARLLEAAGRVGEEARLADGGDDLPEAGAGWLAARRADHASHLLMSRYCR